MVGRFTCSVTHQGEWLGHAATGRRLENADEVYIFGIVDGKIDSGWSLEDDLARMQQLGFLVWHPAARGR